MLLGELFDVKNGIVSTAVKLSEEKTSDSDLPFIRPSSSWKNLVVGYTKRSDIGEQYVFPKDTLIVSTNGEGSHSFSYVSPVDFVPNSDVSVLIPKRPMSHREKVFYAMCITKNRYRFSYGRKPKGRKLESLVLPDIPFEWIEKVPIPTYLVDLPYDENNRLSNDDLAPIGDLFEVVYGSNLELNALEVVEEKSDDTVNFVSRTSRNNGISAIVKKVAGIEPIPAGYLTVAAGGSVLETFVQPEPFYSGRDLYYMMPKREMSLVEKLFFAFCIRANRYRYSYNRQANRTLRNLKIPATLPSWIDEKKLERQIETASTSTF